VNQTYATFIETILGSNTGNAFISRASGKTAAGKLNINIHTTWAYPAQMEEMVAYAEKYQHEDVYLSPLLYGDKKNDKGNIARTPENALTSNTIYMDSDLCTPDKFRLKPSIHVVTSEGRGHDYWVLDNAVDAKRAAEVAHRITTAHKDQGCDPSGWSANKVLRMAGTVNTGHGFPEAVIAEYTGEFYTIEEMEEAYKDVDIYERPVMGRVSNSVEIVEPTDLPDYAEALAKLPQDVLDLALAEVEVGVDGYRSEARYRLLCDLFRLGSLLTYEEVLTIAWHAPACRKWSQEDSRGINGLMMEANKAQAEVVWEAGQGLEPPEEKTEQGAISLLSDGERSFLLENKSWIDTYLNWTYNKLSKQNSPYDRINAWTILSCSFSDVAFIPRKNGPEGLNLYMMTLGETTTGKSQSLKLMRTVLDEVFLDDKGYNLGGNASPNALGEKLIERDNKVSMFSKDEAHGLFKQWSTQDWTTGMMEDLALLYDGTVPPMLRMGKKDMSRAAKTHFVMHLMGTPEEITRSLNREMFKSGFLARFMWSIGEPRTLSKDAVREEDSDGTEIKLGFEPMARQWAAQFADIKRRLRGDTGNGHIPITIAGDAADRMTEVKWAMANLVKKSDPNWDILNPSLVRMGVTIRKCASLLALVEGSNITEMKHVLQAIQAAEEWVKNLFIVAEKISASDFERNCDEVEAYVKAKDNKIKLEFVNRRFKAWRVRDLQEAVGALCSQGRLKEVSDKSGKWLEVNK
jgi:hypothetical protein